MWVNEITPVATTGVEVTRRLAEFGIGDASYVSFMNERNGGYALNHALHLYGIGASREFDDLERRNKCIREIYGETCTESLFFAEDVFGNPFGFARGRVGWFELETGDWTDLAVTFAEWVAVIEGKPDYYSGYALRDQWIKLYGPLDDGELLCPRVPFVLGGEFRADNLLDMAWRDVLETQRKVFVQVRDLPDGTHYELREGEPPGGWPKS